MHMKSLLASAALALATMVSGAALAGTPAISISNTTADTLGNPPFTLGWTFTTNSALVVDELGLFDDSQDGLAESHDLGLWDEGGTLLTSGTIGSGTSGTLIANFRYVDVVNVTLASGARYYVGALFATGSDNVKFPDASGFSSIAAINFDGATYAGGGVLTRPTAGFGGAGFFGPNFTASGAVPEPATWALMIGGFGMAGGMIRRRKAATA